MPLARREMFQLLLLASIVPLQYLISSHSALSYAGSKSKWFKDVIDNFNSYFEKLTKFSDKFWNENSAFWKMIGLSNHQLKEDSHLVKEDLDRHKDYFAGSSVPRYQRNKDMQFRIGDVVLHKILGYRAVVVAWDYTIKATEEWKKVFYEKKQHLFLEPHYLIAIDTRDRLVPQYSYIPQSSLESASIGARVIHPNLDHYFEYFNGKKFIPRPWLQEIYPKD